MGAYDTRAQQPDRTRSRAGCMRAGLELWRGDGARSAHRRVHLRYRGTCRDDPHGELGHRSRDERAAPGPWLYGARQGDKVRRQLPRTQRLHARGRGLRGHDCRRSWQRGSTSGVRARYAYGDVQRPGERRSAVRGQSRSGRGGHRGAGGCEHGGSRTCVWVLGRFEVALRRAWCTARVRRGHLWFSISIWRRGRAVRRGARSCDVR